MSSRSRLLVLLLLVLILSQNRNRILAFFQREVEWTCPQVRVTCIFQENIECYSDKDCKTQEKCCELSCGTGCLDPTQDPCEEALRLRCCPHTVTRWFFNTKDNECYPIEQGTCNDSKNDFQSREICRRTCLAFGHGKPIELFELDGEPFTVMI